MFVRVFHYVRDHGVSQRQRLSPRLMKLYRLLISVFNQLDAQNLLSGLNTEINILRCTVRKMSKFTDYVKRSIDKGFEVYILF